MLQRNCTVL